MHLIKQQEKQQQQQQQPTATFLSGHS